MKGGLTIKVFIKDNLITSNDFDNDMLLAYLGIRQIMQRDKDEYFISLGLLSYQLVGKQIASQLVTTAILSGIKGLIKKKYIISKEADKDRRSNDWVVNLKRLQIDQVKDKENKEYYTPIDSDYILEILNSDNKDKLSILYFYCYLMTTIIKTDEKQGVGFTSYQNMSLATGKCRQTISKYMSKLESLKTIFIYEPHDSIIDDTGIHEIPNTYGDVAYKDKIISVGKSYTEIYGENAKLVKSNRKSSTRSASAKYNIILNDLRTTGEIRYSKEEMEEIYNTLQEYNTKYKDDDLKKIKDLSIFRNYDFFNNGLTDEI